MRVAIPVVLLHLCLGVMPMLFDYSREMAHQSNFPGWPTTVQDRFLEEVDLTGREKYFARDFPGKIGRFFDGENEVIIRWVTHASRKLHPAADCYRGAGFSITPQPITVDLEGYQWNCFTADSDRDRMRVCERIHDAAGQSFSDVSSWFWYATMGQSQGPWWAITIASEV